MADSDPDEFYDCGEITAEQQNKYDHNHNQIAKSKMLNGKYANSDKSMWGGRTHLPSEMFSRNDFSLWSFLKQCIGKELSKITMPIVFNEPLSFLQRLAEYMEYANIVNDACQCDDHAKRLELVTAFAVSATASNWERLGKPFNPLLGETFEYNRDDYGYRMVCEQVSHHPPISAFHVESPNFTFHGSIHPKLKFWGKSVEITPKGMITLYLKKYDEAYSWQNVNCCVHNVIVGKIWIEHYGDMEITNHQTGWKSVVTFHPCGWFGKDLHRLDGYIQDDRKRKQRAFCGKWVDSFYSFDYRHWDEYLRQVNKNYPNKQLQVAVGGDMDTSTSNQSLYKTQSAPSMNNDQVSDDAPKMKIETCLYDLEDLTLLWSPISRPDHSNKYYNFTFFAMQLNELNEDSTNLNLPPTDCRFRPDIRKMELGCLDDASWEKNRLEEKQRAVRKEMKKANKEPEPVWFKWTLNPYTGKDDWILTGDYWKRDWSVCPDIY